MLVAGGTPLSLQKSQVIKRNDKSSQGSNLNSLPQKDFFWNKLLQETTEVPPQGKFSFVSQLPLYFTRLRYVEVSIDKHDKQLVLKRPVKIKTQLIKSAEPEVIVGIRFTGRKYTKKSKIK